MGLKTQTGCDIVQEAIAMANIGVDYHASLDSTAQSAIQ